MAFSDPQPKCLFFDVFGTCVDWRKTVTNALLDAKTDALNATTSSIDSEIRLRASNMTNEDWGDLAQQWRNGYLRFTRSIANDPTIPYKTVDQHHLDSLRGILTDRQLIFERKDDQSNELVHGGSLWDEQQLQELNLVWHRLEPWPDTVQGIRELNKKFNTCTLSNGNVSLLQDMVRAGDMAFTHIYSSEMFKSYKPSPKVYLGAAGKMSLQPSECVMVAAHLDDLKYAKSNGFRTVYVERPREERYPELASEEDIVDVWVKESENGFVTVAEKLGIDTSK